METNRPTTDHRDSVIDLSALSLRQKVKRLVALFDGKSDSSSFQRKSRTAPRRMTVKDFNFPSETTQDQAVTKTSTLPRSTSFNHRRSEYFNFNINYNQTQKPCCVDCSLHNCDKQRKNTSFQPSVVSVKRKASVKEQNIGN
jgi:hypothetical protein